LGSDGGWAVPPRDSEELAFGRDPSAVELPLGVNDSHISRLHGRLVCHGREWTMRNEGRLPMLFPGDAMLLQGQERLVEDAYTPVFIGDLGRRVHSLEIRLVGGRRDRTDCDPDDETVVPVQHELSPVEKLVLTVLAQRYLVGTKHPQPVAWKQVADDMNQTGRFRRDGRRWDEKSTARTVETVRKRLSDPAYPRTVPGLLRDDALGEPLGNALNENLIRALLQSATLVPSDLRAFPHLRELVPEDDHSSR
jgi:hypothetical protein